MGKKVLSKACATALFASNLQENASIWGNNRQKYTSGMRCGYKSERRPTGQGGAGGRDV
jgi:hypothetical protein